MPTLSAIQQHDAIKQVPITFEGGSILNLTLDGNLFTVGFMKRLRALDESDVPAFADMFFSLVKDWDLTDDDGEPLPLDTSTIESLRIETFIAIVKRINESQKPKPGDLDLIVWALSNPDMYEVEVEAGRAEPLPDYVQEWVLARWMGVTLAELQEMNAGDVAKAHVVMQAINRAQDAAHTKAGKR